jgi:hypothetical protein
MKYVDPVKNFSARHGIINEYSVSLQNYMLPGQDDQLSHDIPLTAY